MTLNKIEFENAILGGDPDPWDDFFDTVFNLQESETTHVAALVDSSSETFNADLVAALQAAGLMASS